MAHEILRVKSTHFTGFLLPGYPVAIFFCKVFFHVMHKGLSERGVLLAVQVHTYIYFIEF